MIYKVSHRTSCLYRRPVLVGKHVACLRPRSLPYQQLSMSELHIEPSPISVNERVDYFGNLHYFFTIQEPHRKLVVEARSEVRIQERIESTADDGATASAGWAMPWEEAVQLLRRDPSGAGLDAYEFSFESPRIKLRPEFAAYALESFTPRRAMREGLLDLTARIHRRRKCFASGAASAKILPIFKLPVCDLSGSLPAMSVDISEPIRRQVSRGRWARTRLMPGFLLSAPERGGLTLTPPTMLSLRRDT